MAAMSLPTLCQRCGAEADPGVGSCRRCGSPLAGVEADTGRGTATGSTCWACGAVAPPGSTWCTGCGTNLAPPSSGWPPAGTAAATPSDGTDHPAPVDPGPTIPLPTDVPPGSGVEVIEEGTSRPGSSSTLLTAVLAVTIVVVLAIAGVVAGRVVG